MESVVQSTTRLTGNVCGCVCTDCWPSAHTGTVELPRSDNRAGTAGAVRDELHKMEEFAGSPFSCGSTSSSPVGKTKWNRKMGCKHCLLDTLITILSLSECYRLCMPVTVKCSFVCMRLLPSSCFKQVYHSRTTKTGSELLLSHVGNNSRGKYRSINQVGFWSDDRPKILKWANCPVDSLLSVDWVVNRVSILVNAFRLRNFQQTSTIFLINARRSQSFRQWKVS